MPSEFCSAAYERVQMKYFLNYHDHDNDNSNKPKLICEPKEKWRKNESLRREKGFYYKNCPNFGKLVNEENSFQEINLFIENEKSISI